MNNSSTQNRPRKKRKTDVRLTEDDADAIIIDRTYHNTIDGLVEEVNQIPVWNNRPGPSIPPLPDTQNDKSSQDVYEIPPEIPEFNDHDHPVTGARVCDVDAV